MEQRLSVVTLGVADLDRARRFYEDGLGWTKANPHAEVAFYQLDGMVLALFDRTALAEDAGLPRPPPSSGFGGITLALNAGGREAVDRLMDEAAAAGGHVLKAAQSAFWGGYHGYFADPDGHVWEVAWNPEWELDADGRVTLPYRRSSE